MELLQALSDSALAATLRQPGPIYPLLNAAHILAIGLVVGTIGTLDLRLLGVFRASSLAHLAPPLSRMAAAGIVLALVTGLLLFSVRPVAYAQNPALLAKLGLVVLGVANAAVLHRRAAWDGVLAHGTVGPGVKLQAVLSLLLWTGAVVAGRWIGFLQ